jgi:hypothetical protein
MTNVTRPSHNPSTGLLIKYADSAALDFNGFPISYGEDRSDAYRWNQETGIATGLSVTVGVTPTVPAAPPVAAQSVSVEAWSNSAMHTVRPLQVNAGITVGQARQLYRAANGMEDNLLASVDSVERNDNYMLQPGERVLFRPAMKARG